MLSIVKSFGHIEPNVRQFLDPQPRFPKPVSTIAQLR